MFAMHDTVGARRSLYYIHNDKIYCKEDIKALYGDNDTSNSANEAGCPTSEVSGYLSTSPGKQKSEKTEDKTPQARVRTVFSDKQLKILEETYFKYPNPNFLMKEYLCKVTGLGLLVITGWFQNKRNRCRSMNKALGFDMLAKRTCTFTNESAWTS